MGVQDKLFPQNPQQNARFAATDWSLVLAADGTDTGEARPALSRLLETHEP